VPRATPPVARLWIVEVPTFWNEIQRNSSPKPSIFFS